MTDVEENIRKWLKKQGYPLEMRVANEFKRHGFQATLANYYEDPKSGASREIDVIASSDDHIGFHRVEFVVECKKSKDKPWVLLSSESTSDGYSPLFEYALTSPDAREAFAEGSDGKFLELPWMRYEGAKGVGLVAAFSEQKDIAFDAVRGAMSAAISRRRTLIDVPTSAVIVFPVVVFENSLFECSLDDEDEPRLKEIAEAKLYFPMSFGGESGTCVYVTTAGNLEKFVKDANRAATAIKYFMRPKAEALLEEFKKRGKPITGAVW